MVAMVSACSLMVLIGLDLYTLAAIKAGSAPHATSSAAVVSALYEVLSWRKPPVSVRTPQYRLAAAAGLVGIPQSCSRSKVTSAVDDASGTTRLTSPKFVLLTWWSMLTMGTPSSTPRIDSATRSRLLASTTTTRSKAPPPSVL